MDNTHYSKEISFYLSSYTSITYSSYSVNKRHAGWRFSSRRISIVCKPFKTVCCLQCSYPKIAVEREDQFCYSIIYIIQKTVADGANIHTSVAAWPSHEMFREKVKRFRRNGVLKAKTVFFNCQNGINDKRLSAVIVPNQKH